MRERRERGKERESERKKKRLRKKERFVYNSLAGNMKKKSPMDYYFHIALLKLCPFLSGIKCLILIQFIVLIILTDVSNWNCMTAAEDLTHS